MCCVAFSKGSQFSFYSFALCALNLNFSFFTISLAGIVSPIKLWKHPFVNATVSTHYSTCNFSIYLLEGQNIFIPGFPRHSGLWLVHHPCWEIQVSWFFDLVMTPLFLYSQLIIGCTLRLKTHFSEICSLHCSSFRTTCNFDNILPIHLGHEISWGTNSRGTEGGLITFEKWTLLWTYLHQAKCHFRWRAAKWQCT